MDTSITTLYFYDKIMREYIGEDKCSCSFLINKSEVTLGMFCDATNF